jgi:hypothetical protein
MFLVNTTGWSSFQVFYVIAKQVRFFNCGHKLAWQLHAICYSTYPWSSSIHEECTIIYPGEVLHYK